MAKDKMAILCGGTGLYIDAILKNYKYTAIPIDPELRSQLHDLSKEELLKLFQRLPSSFTELADISTNKRLIRAIEIGTYLQKNQLNADEKTPLKTKTIGIDISRESRRQRISDRLHSRLQNGMVEEVKALLNRNIPPEKIIYYGLEYKFITQYLIGELSYDDMVDRLEAAIHQFAKRQMTYFRKMEKDGAVINWINGELSVEEQLEEAKRLIVHS
ncbi:tRNA dimethylallyltransferase [compost metagenome]